MYGQFLYLLGKVKFLQHPFECHDVNRETGTDYAPKDIIQAARPREWVGEGDEHIRMVGTLFPTRFGGLTELQLMEQQRRAGVSWPLTRGDHVFMGFFFIERFLEHDTFLSIVGIGRVKEYELHLVRSPYAPPIHHLIDIQYFSMGDQTPAQAAGSITIPSWAQSAPAIREISNALV